MSLDVTDQTFEQAVIDQSRDHPVVIDLWAPWCGPCRTLGPLLEEAVSRTEGAVELVKVNVDENPQVSAAFRVQSIPAVYAMREGKVVDGFIGAVGEAAVNEFVNRLLERPSEADLLVAHGDESSLRQALELQPDHLAGVTALAEMLVDKGETDEALTLLERVPESAQTRQIAARARLRTHEDGGLALHGSALDQRFEELLARVKSDDAARQEFVDLLETLPEEDPRRTTYRKALAARLF